VEFGKHLKKGIWGLADKALPVVYGFGYVVLVIRVLPQEEFGNFVLTQEVFLIISGLATAFALQPLLKYSSEAQADISSIASASMLLNVSFVVVASILVVGLARPAGALFNSSGLTPLLLYVPAMLAASFLRNFTTTLLQARFHVREVFWMDAIHFLGAPFLVWVMSRMHEFDTAMDLVAINIVSLSCSSLVGLWFARGMMKMTILPARGTIRKMWDYGKYSLGGIVSSLFTSKADSFILSVFSGPAQVAVYNSAKVFVRVYEMATQIVQMFVLPAVSKLSSQGESGSLRPLIEKAILFLTVGLLPVTVLFLVFPNLLVNILYGGRYAECVPLLRTFSVLSFIVPLMAVESNLLMGLGHMRLSFVIGLQMLVIAIISYVVFIPWLAELGAAIGYVGAAALTTWILVNRTRRLVPISLAGVTRRLEDIVEFLKSRLLH